MRKTSACFGGLKLFLEMEFDDGIRRWNLMEFGGFFHGLTGLEIYTYLLKPPRAETLHLIDTYNIVCTPFFLGRIRKFNLGESIKGG